MSRWIKQDNPLVIAHRGNSVFTLENTMSAYHKSIEIINGGIIGGNPTLTRRLADTKR